MRFILFVASPIQTAVQLVQSADRPPILSAVFNPGGNVPQGWDRYSSASVHGKLLKFLRTRGDAIPSKFSHVLGAYEFRYDFTVRASGRYEIFLTAISTNLASYASPNYNVPSMMSIMPTLTLSTSCNSPAVEFCFFPTFPSQPLPFAPYCYHFQNFRRFCPRLFATFEYLKLVKGLGFPHDQVLPRIELLLTPHLSSLLHLRPPR